MGDVLKESNDDFFFHTNVYIYIFFFLSHFSIYFNYTLILTVPNNLINNLQSYLLFLCFNISSHFSPTCRQSLLQVIFIIPKNFFLLSIRSNYSTLEALDPIVPFPPTTRQCPTEEEWGNVVCCGSSTSVCREPLTSNLSPPPPPTLFYPTVFPPRRGRSSLYKSYKEQSGGPHTSDPISRVATSLGALRHSLPNATRTNLSISLSPDRTFRDR